MYWSECKTILGQLQAASEGPTNRANEESRDFAQSFITVKSLKANLHYWLDTDRKRTDRMYGLDSAVAKEHPTQSVVLSLQSQSTSVQFNIDHFRYCPLLYKGLLVADVTGSFSVVFCILLEEAQKLPQK